MSRCRAIGTHSHNPEKKIPGPAPFATSNARPDRGLPANYASCSITLSPPIERRKDVFGPISQGCVWRPSPEASASPADRPYHLIDLRFFLVDGGTGAEQRSFHGAAITRTI